MCYSWLCPSQLIIIILFVLVVEKTRRERKVRGKVGECPLVDGGEIKGHPARDGWLKKFSSVASSSSIPST